MKPFPNKRFIQSLTNEFQDLKVWEYYSISKLKNSMYCPEYLHYLSRGIKQKKIVTAEGIQGSAIHEKLDVTEKEEVEPWEAAVYNICAVLDSLYSSYYFDEASVLTELPFFSPQRKIYGYPDILFINNNGSLSIEIIERKTRMRKTDPEGLPYIFADDIFQLHVQREIIRDILGYASDSIQELPFRKININSYIELRNRGINYEKPTPESFREQLENSIQSLSISDRKILGDNYQGIYSIPVLYNQPELKEEPLYCKIDSDMELIGKRFSYVEKVLLDRDKPCSIYGEKCNPRRRKYCGYSHLCIEQEKQLTIDRFIPP